MTSNCTGRGGEGGDAPFVVISTGCVYVRWGKGGGFLFVMHLLLTSHLGQCIRVRWGQIFGDPPFPEIFIFYMFFVLWSFSSFFFFFFGGGGGGANSEPTRSALFDNTSVAISRGASMFAFYALKRRDELLA